MITGASEGIGAACAASFRQRGARLSLVARSREKLEQAGGADALIVAGDLLDPAFRRDAVARTIERYGRIDILVNNAGVGVYQPAHRMEMDLARRMVELNFFAPLELAQLVVEGMKQRREGAVVNVGSIGGKVTLPWFTVYSATKYALGSLTEGLRMELAQDNIHSMVVCPGYVRTRFQQNVLAGSPPRMEGLRERWAVNPDQVAEALCRGLERNARTVMVPWSGWFLVAAARLFPGVVEHQFEAIYRKLGLGG